MFKGRKAETDNGWTGYGPWPYTVLDETDLAHHVERLSTVHTDGATQSLTIQPYPAPNKNQDRHTITQWNTPQGVWKIFSVFDGHAGHDTVDYANSNLIPALEAAVLDAQSSASGPLEPASVIEVLKASVSAFDDDITHRFLALFPGGPEAISQLSDDEIRSVVLVDGKPHPIIPLCLAGSTVLIAILDPARQLYVVSLGDSIGILGLKDPNGSWQASLLSAFHNGLDPGEAARINSEHPGEPECVLNGRVLGGIAVTRALGDHIFKLPSIYADRVGRIAYADAHIIGKIDGFLPRCLTPPYLSNVPHIEHVDLSGVTPGEAVLVLASDGLGDLMNEHNKLPLTLAERWIKLAAGSDKPALSILRDAMGGDDMEKASFWITVEMEEPWMDDTTIVVTKL